jgi:hypothetical protein
VSRKARESAATKTLLQHVESRSTGRLSVGARASEVSVWVLKGEIVAATSPPDEAALVRLAGLSGALDPSVREDLERRLAGGESVFGPLLDAIPGPLAERLLHDRFRANLADYLGSMSRPAFAPLTAVFVDNLQLGGDTHALVAACGAAADSAGSLDLDAVIGPGPGHPQGEFEAALQQALLREPSPIGALLGVLAWEPVLVRGWIQGALDSGVAIVQPVANGPEDDWSEDDATEHDAEPPVVLQPISVAPEPAPEPEPELQLDEPEVVDDPPTPDTADIGQSGASLLAAAAAEEDAGDAPSEPPPDLAPEQAASVKSWLSKAHAVEESELDFFEDHDSTRRGGSEDGSFSTGQHNLDKVEVNLGEGEEPETELEADEAPAARFSAPTIGEDEAETKVEVINSVLRTICEAFDRAEGPGRGRAAFQLLIEGSPPRYQVIFDSVQVGEEGTLPPGDILSNLLARPATEQRMLLTQALSDLIERALSGAADELPDQAVDALLEETAGYRGRLGL